MNEGFDWSNIASGVLAIVGSYAGYLFGRRKNNAEALQAEATAQHSELDNVEKAVAIWRGMASDLEGKFKSVQDEVMKLQKTVMELKYENERLGRENTILQGKIEELQRTVNHQ